MEILEQIPATIRALSQTKGEEHSLLAKSITPEVVQEISAWIKTIDSRNYRFVDHRLAHLLGNTMSMLFDWVSHHYLSSRLRPDQALLNPRDTHFIFSEAVFNDGRPRINLPRQQYNGLLFNDTGQGTRLTAVMSYKTSFQNTESDRKKREAQFRDRAKIAEDLYLRRSYEWQDIISDHIFRCLPQLSGELIISDMLTILYSIPAEKVLPRHMASRIFQPPVRHSALKNVSQAILVDLVEKVV